MLFRIKIGFVLPVGLLLLGCVFTAPVVAGQTSAESGSAAANAAIVDAAAKEAAEKAGKKAEVKAELEKNPLVITGIVPYVEPDDKGTFGDPPKLGKAGMGDRISVVITNLSRAAEVELIDPNKLVLFVDGRVFKDVYPESVGYDSVVYKLERTKDAIDSWNGLLGSPRLDSIKPVVVSVGYADQKPFGLAKNYHEKANLNLIVYRKRWAVASLIVLILILLVFWKYGGRDLLRDSGPPNPEPGKRPYSLAKVQVAWWFFLVVGSFLVIYLITGEFTMTEQALILIGIGAGTALGSAMIDNSKRGSADSQLEALRPQQATLKVEIDQLNEAKAELEKAVAANQGATDAEKASLKTDQESLNARKVELAGKVEQLNTVNGKIEDAKSGLTTPKSKTLWHDLVTDASGPSFHRFQMIVWTVILGILFLAGVYKNLAMPEFSGTMLALMGISAGTYLGFKIPEKQNTADLSGKTPATPQPGVAPAQVQQDAAAVQVQPGAG